ncbi:MAG: hydrogenase formation protein HypD [Methanobacteriota archaeon]|nr:MAG: hydrogenase formation protein HypD [Euryarchaeota archaeon]
MFRLRDREMSQKILKELKEMRLDITLMHVCGTHQDTLVRFGLDSEFQRVGIDIRQGPGCPVCITPPQEIETTMALARAGITIAAFGDLMRVPGKRQSLGDIKAEGGDVRIVFGVDDAVDIARQSHGEVVFVGIGFETTAPTTATALLSSPPDNFSVLSFHRIVPPALRAISSMGEIKLHGMIQPGHVSAIIGTAPYEFLSEEYGIPQVVAGFEPLDLMVAVYLLAKQHSEGRGEVQNEYSRVVKPAGNPTALKAIRDAFTPTDAIWRGFPVIPESGMSVKNELEIHDASKRFSDTIAAAADAECIEPDGCRCGEILRGIITSEECPLFDRKCTPENPIGPCMVSREGSCHISHRYRRTRLDKT